MAYDKSFYEEQSLGSRNSAQEIVPYLLKQFPINSVVDLGCGLGTWLAVFGKNGVRDLAGYDGDYVPRDYLQIPNECFHPADLCSKIDFGQRFSLSMSLEVAEHISPVHAAEFVDKLISLSDIVMFSCAFPYQGGTGHVNENYPEYWAMLFRKRGYIPLDIIRDTFWFNGMVCPWYRQNILIFMKEELWKERYSHLPSADGKPLTRIHPEMYLWSCVRPRDVEIPPAVFETDKIRFYPLLDAWRNHEAMPQNTHSYGSEYNIEYSELPWTKRMKLKLKYYLRRNH